MKKIISAISGKRILIAALVIMFSFIVVSAFSENTVLLIISILLTAIFLVFVIAITLFEMSGKVPDSGRSILSNLTVDFLMKLDMPVLILGEDNVIIWYNKAFSRYDSEHKILYGKSVKDATGGQLYYGRAEQIKNSATPTSVNIFNTPFEISAFPISSKGRSYYLTIWHDNSKFVALKDKLDSTSPLVAYIVVDNLTEIIQNIQEDYRTASANIAKALMDWANSFGAVIKEYERDKFFMIFNRKHLITMEEEKFNVLDIVRQQSEAQLGMSLTVTIGIANINGSFAEKDTAAKQALEYGLHRGGDQAVIKSATDTKIFGGKTRTVEKRTKIRSRIIATELEGLIKNSSNILIMMHKYSDYDSLAAAVGIARLCLHNEKKVHIVSNENDINLMFVRKKLKELSIYDNVFVDKITGQDLISADTLLVVVDTNNRQLFESSDIFDNVRTKVIIDHHRKTEEYTTPVRLSYIEPSASSASELIREILEHILPAGLLEKEEAELLLAGIMLDTKNFSRNAGVRTFSAAVYLRSEGANPADAQLLFKMNSTDFIKQAKFESSTIIYKKIYAISAINEDLGEEDKIAAAKAADRMLLMDGVLASFVFCRVGDIINISARSSGTVNVQLILENIGGGGRYDVAGAQLEYIDMEKALIMLKESIDKVEKNTEIDIQQKN